MDIRTYITEAEQDYELIDSGDGEKLERYGSFTVSRPDPQALQKRRCAPDVWQAADAQYVRIGAKGEWKTGQLVPKRWEVTMGGLRLWVKTSSFKHTGIFPEQASNWKWIEERVSKRMSEKGKVSVLNLFGYTGGATLAAAKAGAEVVHVDGSKVALTWARENAELSGLGEKPVRWILDDALAFVEREVRRGTLYDAVIMDPPSFGRGPKGEVWKIEEQLMKLLELVKKILSTDPVFVLINGYASGYSALAYGNILADIMKGKGGKIEVGELAIKESKTDRLLPAGITARWFS